MREGIEDLGEGSGGVAVEGFEGGAVGELGDEGGWGTVVEVEVEEGGSDEGE